MARSATFANASASCRIDAARREIRTASAIRDSGWPSGATATRPRFRDGAAALVRKLRGELSTLLDLLQAVDVRDAGLILLWADPIFGLYVGFAAMGSGGATSRGFEMQA